MKRKVKKVIRDGVVYRTYMANEKDCKGCKSRAKCLMRENTNRRTLNVPIGYVSGNLTKEMAQKIDTKEGRNIYHQRIAIVEPVFANIKCMKRLDRFTLRGKIKVNIQWILYCMVHNMEKIANYGFT
ncbi:MAG: transposase [Deltaproteobacteria bacterium]|nr:transposase [Deltaproteobacteria bacterium]